MSDELYRPPTMPVYVDRLIADTQDLSAEEFGVYWRLLCRQWSKGHIPADNVRQAHIGGVSPQRMRSVRAAIGQRLQAHPSIDAAEFSPFQEDVRREMEVRNKKASDSGKRGAQKRWHGDSDPIATPSKNDGDPISDPINERIANEWENDKFQSPISNKSPNGDGGGPPKQPKLPTKEPSDLAAWLILDAAWPIISGQHDLAIKREAWRKHNKSAAKDLADNGKTPEQVADMLTVAYTHTEGRRYYGGITTLAKLIEHWPKIAALDEPEEELDFISRAIANGGIRVY